MTVYEYQNHLLIYSGPTPASELGTTLQGSFIKVGDSWSHSLAGAPDWAQIEGQ